jgi:GNAT superfamily N-acetyltransferase
VRRGLEGGYELDDDRERIDLDTVYRFIGVESYWAAGRERAVVEASIAGSARVLGLYHGDQQVGFCRAISDGAVFALLADVFVDTAHRGRGLGVAMVREMVDRGPLCGVNWGLDTRDAQGLYAKFGFTEPMPPPTIMTRRAGDGS